MAKTRFSWHHSLRLRMVALEIAMVVCQVLQNNPSLMPLTVQVASVIPNAALPASKITMHVGMCSDGTASNVLHMMHLPGIHKTAAAVGHTHLLEVSRLCGDCSSDAHIEHR
jgi:hypothetical protein